MGVKYCTVTKGEHGPQEFICELFFQCLEIKRNNIPIWTLLMSWNTFRTIDFYWSHLAWMDNLHMCCSLKALATTPPTEFILNSSIRTEWACIFDGSFIQFDHWFRVVAMVTIRRGFRSVQRLNNEFSEVADIVEAFELSDFWTCISWRHDAAQSKSAQARQFSTFSHILIKILFSSTNHQVPQRRRGECEHSEGKWVGPKSKITPRW